MPTLGRTLNDTKEHYVQGEIFAHDTAKSQVPVLQDAVHRAVIWIETMMESFEDASHDVAHVIRVRRNAIDIAQHEGLSLDRQHIVELIALLHDITDKKYKGWEQRTTKLDAFLQTEVSQRVIDKQQKQLILEVIGRMSYKDEVKGSCIGELPIELKIVQDADRLDAMGAIGIARCFTFGGKRNRPIMTLGRETSIHSSSGVQHFYDKLLLLKNLMKTERGKELAESRHAFMESFLEQIEREISSASA